MQNKFNVQQLIFEQPNNPSINLTLVDVRVMLLSASSKSLFLQNGVFFN